MPDFPSVCPLCNSGDQCSKISLIYLESTAWLNNKETESYPHAQQVFAAMSEIQPHTMTQKALLANMVQAFAPPSGEKQVAQRVHPDLFIGLFSLLGTVILFRMAQEQPGMFLYGIGVFIVAVVTYLATRNKVLQKYETLRANEKEQNRLVERAIARWMQAYYCARDQVVFYPGKSTYAPLNELRSFLRDA